MYKKFTKKNLDKYNLYFRLDTDNKEITYTGTLELSSFLPYNLLNSMLNQEIAILKQNDCLVWVMNTI